MNPDSEKQSQVWIYRACFLFVAFLILVPLIFLVFHTFTSSANFIRIFTQPKILTLFLNTFSFALGSTLLASLIGITLAWINERTDTPCKALFFTFALIPLIIPELLFTISWTLLLSPKTGVINGLLIQFFGLEQAPFNIYSLAGMIWIEGLSASPLAFLLMTGIFRMINATYEEMALICGANPLQAFRLITLKLGKPAILSAFMLIVIKNFATFGVPAIIGLPAGIKVFSSDIYLALRNYPTDYGLASAYSVLLIFVASLGVFFNNKLVKNNIKYTTVTGKEYRLGQLNIGPWRYLAAGLGIVYFILTFILPFLILIWSSLQPFYQPPNLESLKSLSLDNYKYIFNYPNILRATKQSLLLSTASSSIVLFVSAIIAWFAVKSKFRYAWLLENLALVPITVPGLILGVAIMFFYLYLPLPIYGTLWILLIGYVAHNLPYGVRYATASMIQIHPELEEAALICGATWWQQFQKITLPLLKSGLITGWIYVFILSLRQLSTPLLLYSPGSEVLSVTIWELWISGDFVILSALGSLMIALFTVLAIILQRFSK